MGRSLIVNADDLGWSVEVNAGIIKAYTQGVVTSCTLMATMPGAADAVGRLRDCPDLGVGVHLTLTSGEPVSADRSVRRVLAGGGNFPTSLLGLLWHARTSKRWRQAAEAELGAQIEWMLQQGLHPDHLDSHKHIHVVDPFPEMVARLAQRYRIRCIRNTCERPRVRIGTVGPTARLRRRLLHHWGHRAGKVFEKAGLIQPETFFGIEDTGRPNIERVRTFFETCAAGTVEWMVHPGNRESPPSAPTRLVESRWLEKKMLTEAELAVIIARCGFRLVRYKELSQ